MLRQLEYFVALAREQHFARAAAACYVSQPALSEAIRKLEAELGVPLVRRGHSFQGLTAEGKKVLPWARRMLLDHEALRQEVEGLQEALSGRLRLGVVPAVSSTVVELTVPFTASHRRVSIQVQTSLHSSHIIEQVRGFELDAGIIYAAPEDAQDLVVLPLYTEDHVLITGPGMLTEAAVPGWRQALDLPLCLLDSRMRGRQVLDAALERHGMSASPRIETDSVLSLLSHVATGQWASIVPRQWLAPLGPLPGIRMTALSEPELSPQISLVLNASEPMPLMSRALLRTAREVYP